MILFGVRDITRRSIAGGLSLLLGMMPGLVPLAHASPLSSSYDGVGGKLENQEQNGFYSPSLIRQRLTRQESVVNNMKRREERQQYLQQKSLGGVLKNVQELLQAKFQSQDDFENEMERRRKAAAAVFGAGGLFTFVKYADGKKVWLKDGQVAKVEHETILDARGHATIRNMDNMEYNDRGLLISYTSRSTDSEGHTTTTNWHGATYTEDSVAYGGDGTHYKKLLTGYTEEVTDDRGNTTSVDWRNASYNDQNQLTSYKQISVDAQGNQSTKAWSDGTYDANGQLASYKETDTDSLGLTTERNWHGGTY